MARYIDADRMIRRLNKSIELKTDDAIKDLLDDPIVFFKAVYMAQRLIETEKRADVRENTRAQWDIYGATRVCSQCNGEVVAMKGAFNYCPTCGAAMGYVV